MKHPRSRVTWSIAIAAVLGIAMGAVLDRSFAESTGGGALEDLALLAAFASFPLFGALVLTRGNRLGVVFLGFGVLGALGFVGQTYGRIGLVLEPGKWPGAVWGGWIEQWWWYPAIALLICYLPLLFPNGRVPSRAWRPVLWILTVALGIVVFGGMFKERIGGDGYSADNPIGFLGITELEQTLGPVFLVIAVCALLSVLSLIQRYLRADTEQRQQIKWFLFTIAFAVVGMILGDFLQLPDVLFPLTLLALMGGIAVSVLKYRLYDIDVIINRALVYGVLTAALIASYFAIVVALGRLLDPLTRDSDVAVAGSTLAVAALFRPLRARIQGFIDRRFYRSKYDAGQAVTLFAARLRDEIDVDSVRTDVLGVVGETLQPRHASLWLSPERAL